MDNSSIIVFSIKKYNRRHRIPLKVCNRISRIIMGLVTWMKKCVVSVQIWMKRISMEGDVVGFFGGGRNVLRSSTAVGFCNDSERVGPRWVLRT